MRASRFAAFAPARSASLFAAFALALSASPARGAPVQAGVEPVTVLAFQVDAMADAELDRAAKSLTNALRQAVLDAPEYTLGGQSPTIYAAAYDAKCPLKVAPGRPVNESTFDEACLRKVGRSLGAKRFLWGFLSPGDGQSTVARLHLWQEGRPGRSVSLPYDPAARDRVVERLYRKLVTPERVGDVALAGAVEGELVVDGNAAGPYAPGVELTLPAGEHAIEVRQGLRVVARSRALVSPSGRADSTLTPVAEPSPPPPATTLPPPLVFHPRPSAWPWVLGGTAVAGLAGAGVFWGLRAGVRSDLEAACFDGGCPEGERDAVDRGRLSTTLAGASLGVGLAAGAGLGTYLLLARRGRPITGALAPLPGGGAFAVSGAF